MMSKAKRREWKAANTERSWLLGIKSTRRSNVTTLGFPTPEAEEELNGDWVLYPAVRAV